MAKVEHDREGCIGSGACAAIDPENWEMGDDGKSNLKSGNVRGDGWFEKNITPEQVEKQKECANNCPAGVIHVQE